MRNRHQSLGTKSKTDHAEFLAPSSLSVMFATKKTSLTHGRFLKVLTATRSRFAERLMTQREGISKRTDASQRGGALIIAQESFSLLMFLLMKLQRHIVQNTESHRVKILEQIDYRRFLCRMMFAFSVSQLPHPKHDLCAFVYRDQLISL